MRENSKATTNKRSAVKNTKATTTNNKPQQPGRKCGNGKTCSSSKACK